ncbi:uncharacterized protein PgNI_07972 [Pyricularia grisea]|uniref:Uncharacterized protein n=1 Tax=Pyricularia grisea TaxID=148305 RepID=A0A6P8B2S2_PYRGI|nr:uncharacterized protein PgNI_07972 [Pyricularia grisea]TLD09210.1 hypothetical protein PgNI_07972 [Pyricularia grisea]
MAAPEGTSILNITGTWSLSSSLSDDLGPTFMAQNIPWIIRRVISYASLELKMIQKAAEPPERPATVIDVIQTVRPGGFDSENSYILDGETRTDKVPIFGAMSMKAVYVPMAEVSTEDIMGQVIEQPSATDDRVAIKEMTEGVNTGWKTTALWAFQEIDGERRFCKYCTTTKGEEKVQARLVYDYKATSE